MPFTTRQLKDATQLADPLLRLGAINARVPGVAFGMQHEGETLLLSAFGVADVASARPVDATTTSFRCASITKSFTATLVMRLAERGRLRLDDGVRAWLPWTSGALGDDVTVRHLLMHAGGVIRDGSNDWELSLPDTATLHQELQRSATFTEPSERFRYSNIAYVMLGEIAERASGRPFGPLLRREVLTPLGLDASYPDLVPAARRTLATGYWGARANEEREPAEHVEARAIAPAGGLISTVPDLLEYQSAHLPSDPRLLSELSKREMQRAQWQRAEEPHYGFGWMTWHVDGIALVGHSGGYPGFVTRIAFAPKEGLAAAVLTNTSSSFAGDSIQLLYHLVATVAKRWDEAEATTRWHTRGSLAPFVGCFRNRGTDIYVARVNGSLFVMDPLAPSPLATAARLEPKSARRFLIADGDDFGFLGELVSFDADRSGRITKLHLGAHVFTREEKKRR